MAGDDEPPEVTATAPAVGPPGSPLPADPARMDLAELLPSCSPGQFQLGGEIGRGGIGRVLRGRDPVFDRPIAIKELLSTSSTARARFLREAMITARLQHPAIVPVYLAGRWPDGSPFYGMKLVEGKPLSEALRERKTLRDRIALLPSVIATCEAIAFAHRHRIVHRDLKPSNVLLGELGETVVIDWGLAKDLDEADDPAGAYGAVATASETIAGAVIGTPAYMPPEQGAGREVDERGDVYSLGAILYELLAGAMPYADSRTPRAILEALADHAPRPLRELVPEAPRDLVAITERAMARDPQLRYADAAALAEDLRRFQTGQLVSVREYGRLERTLRWMRRHRAAVAVGAAALLVLAVVGITSAVGIVRAQRRAEAAARAETIQRARAEDQRDEALIANAVAIVRDDPAAALVQLAKMSPHSARWKSVRTLAADAYAGRIPALFDPGFRVEWLELSPDERTLAVGSQSARQAMVYDLATGAAKHFDIAPGQQLGIPSRDLRYLTTTAPELTTIRVADGHVTHYDTRGESTRSLAFSPNGEWIAAASATNVFVFPISGGPGRVVEGARVSLELDDAGTLYALDFERTDVLINTVDGVTRRIAMPIADRQLGVNVDLGPDAYFRTWRYVFMITPAKKIGVLDTFTGTFALLPDQTETFLSYTSNEDATAIVGSTASDQNVRWERDATGWHRVEIFLRPGVTSVVGTNIVGRDTHGLWIRRDGAYVVGRFHVMPYPSAVTRDASALFAITPNGMIARWDLRGGNTAICGQQTFVGVALDRLLLQTGSPGALYVCDPVTGTQRVLLGGTKKVRSVIPAKTFQFAVTRGHDNEIVVWDIARGSGVVLAATGAPAAISNDGATVFLDDGTRYVAVDVATAAVTPRCPGLPTGVLSAIDDEAAFAIHVATDALHICDLRTGELRTLPGYSGERYVGTLLILGALVYVDGAAGPALWNLRTRERYMLDTGARERIGAAELLRGGKGIVLASQRMAAIFDERGRLETTVSRTSIAPSGVTAADDRRAIITTDFLEHARVFDLETQRSRVLDGPEGAFGAGFFAGDRVIVTLDSGGRVYRFEDEMPRAADAIRARIVETAAAFELDADGRSIPARSPAR